MKDPNKQYDIEILCHVCKTSIKPKLYPCGRTLLFEADCMGCGASYDGEMARPITNKSRRE